VLRPLPLGDGPVSPPQKLDRRPAFLVASIPLKVTWIPREEEMMLDQFGDEYRRYVEKTERVVPRCRG